MYSAANPVHPAGHVGWWKWPLEIKGDLTRRGRQERPTDSPSRSTAPRRRSSGRIPTFSGLDEPVIALHVVLRPVISEAVRFDDILYVYNSPVGAGSSREARRNELDNPHAAAPSVPWYVWPRQSMVHLVSTNVFERDAVGNFALSVHRLLRANGIACQLYAGNFDPTLRETIRHTCELFDAAARGRPGVREFFDFRSLAAAAWSNCRARRFCIFTTSRRRGFCRSTTPSTPTIAPTASRN